MLQRQHGKCAICKEDLNMSFSVDHDHDVNFVRGLLCQCCNRGLGSFKDNAQSLRNAARYLETAMYFPKARQRRRVFA
jgi:hypothetical protein